MHLAKRRGKFGEKQIPKKNPKEIQGSADRIFVQRDC